MNSSAKIVAGLLVLVNCIPNARAFRQPNTPQLPNFDRRTAATAEPLPAASAAAKGLTSRVPGLKVDFDEHTGTPKWIQTGEGFLSGPAGSGRGISPQTAAAFATNDVDRATKAFLQEHQALFGFGPEVLAAARSRREFVTPHSGLRTVVWDQELDGISVFEAVLISHTTKDGELVNLSSQFIPAPGQAADFGTPNRQVLAQTPVITSAKAVALSMKNLGENLDESGVTISEASNGSAEQRQRLQAALLAGDADAKLQWLPVSQQSLRLCWQVILTSRARGEMYLVLIDAETGEPWVRHRLTEYLTDATYRVWTSDSPSPFSPGYSTPQTNQPPVVPRQLVTLSALNTNASPNGWIDDGNNETSGNNVDAHTDRNADNVPDLPRPQGNPTRVFDFNLDLAQPPTAYTNASVVQLFYLNNWMHDKLYELGFTEAAGNFQNNNFGRGGAGNDAVQADAQDGSGTDNANFSTPQDGSPGRMQMYVFTGPNPDRDGDLDAEVVLHEYTHGLSNRRVGGGVGISALQSAGMGEGWSDFYGLTLLSEAGDDVNGVYAAGGYASFLINSSEWRNYYFGIRRYPYCTDMSKNPLTLNDIDSAQADNCASGAPYNTEFFGTCSTANASEVHNIGELWCMTLWEARANLITKYGWAIGNQLILKLVTDGMNLGPANPTILQARDAILQADQVYTGGANRASLWAAFAKRGMGLTASVPASSTTTGVIQKFDLPDDLQIIPSILASAGPVGGPFTPNPAYFTLTNTGSNTLTWALASTAGWFSVAPTSGTLAAGAGATVAVTLSTIVTNFPLGTTNSLIWFTNQVSGVAQSRTYNLSVVGRSMFENFEPGIHMSLWSAFGGTVGTTVIATNYGGSVSPVNSLWFGDAGSRFAATIPINTSAGGTISFYLRLGNSSYPWEQVDLPAEGIVLEYSTNNGASWTVMGTYDTTTFYNWTQINTNIPAGALSAATQFRWRQLSNSGSDFDHWAIDDVSIDAGPTPPYILTQPVSSTVKVSSNVTFTVSAQGSFPLNYQWRKNGTNLSDGGRITGATTATLSISNLAENDSGQYSVVVTNVYGSVTSSNATLLVTPLDHFNWSVIGSPQAVGVPFNATVTAKDPFDVTVTNYAGTVALSAANAAGSKTNMVLGNLVSAGSGSGVYTLGFAFTPNTNIVVTHVRSMSGTKVSIWLTNGTLLASQNVVSTPGTWVETPLATPLTLPSGTTYIVSFYSATTYYYRSDRTNTFPDGTIENAYYYYAGDGFPITPVVSSYVYLVDLKYITGASANVPITPATAGPFTNGIWSGSITIQQPATNLVLRADDGAGHSGSSNPIDALLQNDLSISVADAPDPVSVGANLTYTLTIANAGPTSATSVTVTNVLPPTVSFVSVTSSQGTCTQAGGVVSGNLGVVPGASNATITIVVVPNSAGILTNYANVFRAEADPFPGNNSAVATTVAQFPALSISDCAVLERNVGTTNALFTVSLNSAAALTVTVNYATADGTALAGSDYIATNGTLSFAPGQTNKTIVVVVRGDTLGEPDETFYVNLTSPVNVTLADPVGLGTIVNDDLPSAAYVRSIAGAPWGSVANETAMNRVFGTNNWQDLRYETLNVGTLLSPVTTFIYMEGSDSDATEMETFLNANINAIQNWVSNGGSLFLNAAPNEDNGMSMGFGVTLLYPDSTSTGQAALPAHRIFAGPFTPVGLSWSGSSFAHATVSGTGLTTLITNTANGHTVLGEKSYGAGHVLFGGMTTDNFHSPQPQGANLRANIIAYLSLFTSYHFEWSAIASPQQFNVPFPVTITAKDTANAVVTNFTGAVALSAVMGSNQPISITPVASDSFTNGIWSGMITVQQPGLGIVLNSDDGAGRVGSSNPFDVVAPNDIYITVADSPDPVSVGANLTYNLKIANVGPSSATGVTVTNVLPANVSFVSATSSQGSCTQAGGVVTGNLGVVPGGTNATITIVVVPNSPGVLSNYAAVFRAEADPFPGNNSAVATTVAQVPALSISDCAVLERNVGTTNALFTVSLNSAAALTVTVNYATADGTAVAGSDYIATNGTLSFAPGQTNKTIVVVVRGDTLGEGDENFFVNLTSPVNATLADSQGIGTILNDDVPSAAYVRSTAGAPWGSLSNETAMNRVFGTNNWQDLRYETVNVNTLLSPLSTFIYMEGSDSDATEMETFLNANINAIQNWVSNGGNLFLNAAPNEDNGMSMGFGVTLLYPDATATGAAVLPAHRIFNGPFTPVGSTWTGNSFAHATVSGTGLTALIANTANGHIVLGEKSYGAGHVLFGGMTTDNFHSPQPQAANLRANIIAYTSSFASYHFEWSPVSSPQQINVPFAVTITAQDPANAVLTNFTGALALSAVMGSNQPISITPASSDSFTNGIWSGMITVLQPGQSIVLNSDDGAGRIGSSNPFDVIAPDDIGLTAIDNPNPVALGANVTYTLTVTNSGPTSALGVTLTNNLAPGAGFVSATASQGACLTNGNVVSCDLGTINGGATAVVSIVATAGQPGNLTNQAAVFRQGADAYLGNNTASLITPVLLPSISINDVTIREGNVGTTNAVFTVTIAPAPAQVTAVAFNTAPSTASAPSDYLSTNGIIVFAPGQTTQTVSVVVNGDTTYELDETFLVSLSGATNANLGKTIGLAIIVNDDNPPSISIGDVTVPEGNVGTNLIVFPVTLSASNGLTTTVSYTTVNGTATNGSDYVGKSGSLTFPAGVTSNFITIAVIGDTQVEGDEDFYVDLSNQANATLAKREGVATLLNDDGLAGQADHFAWSPTAPIQYVNEPFAETITALDAFNNPASSFNGTAILSGQAAGSFVSNTILPTLTIYSSGYLGGTCGYSFTPTNEITITHVRSYSGTKVSIWTDAGVLLVSQPVSGTVGVWTETPLSTPLKLTAGVRYRVGVYSPNSNVYYAINATNVFPAGTVDQGYLIFGDAFPTSISTFRFFVDLRFFRSTLAPVQISPVNTGPFTNGVWAGNITVPSMMTNLILRADDGNGHNGQSTQLISVLLHNDISLAVSDSPRPVCLNGKITYSLVVSNSGPLTATNVTVTNLISALASFVSVSSDRGTCTNNGNTVMCDLGSMKRFATASITIVASVGQLGNVTNKASVYRADFDPFTANNSVTNVTQVVSLPSLTINDVSVREGNSGTTNALFTVSLSPPPAVAGSVNFATANQTASAPGDYSSTNGVLSFAVGETNKTISVSVNGNTIYGGPNKTFLVLLSGAVNATLIKSSGIGTIVNDEPIPALSIADATLLEGNVGTTNAVFVVTLSVPSSLTTTFFYSTANGSASSLDYIPKTGTISLPPLVTSTNLVVTILSEMTVEADETFYVDLSSPVNATLAKREAVGTIVNDDGIPGWVDHFAWNALPASQYAGVPFAGTIVALDAFGGPANTFTGTVNLTATDYLGVPMPITPSTTAVFNNAAWTGNLVETLVATNLTIRADDGNGHTGLSGAINILPHPVLSGAISNGWLTLSWTGPFMLQSCTNVVGPYDTIPDAVSPWPIDTTKRPQSFFRLLAAPAPEPFPGRHQ